MSWYEIAFEGITRFEFADRHADAWRSTELTEIYTRAGEDGTRFTFTLAHINDALNITCQDSRAT